MGLNHFTQFLIAFSAHFSRPTEFHWKTRLCAAPPESHNKWIWAILIHFLMAFSAYFSEPKFRWKLGCTWRHLKLIVFLLALYGFASCDESKGILLLRNPSRMSNRLDLDISQFLQIKRGINVCDYWDGMVEQLHSLRYSCVVFF